MPSNEALTMVLLTHNRPAFLARILRYYSNFPYKLIVLDSSTESNKVVAEKYDNGLTSYYHCRFGYNELISKIQFGLSQVSTPLMVFLSDYSLCMGYTLLYLAASEKVHYFAREIRGIEDFNDESPVYRIKRLFGSYYPPYYAVTRTDMQKNWFNHISDEISFDYLEFGHAFELLNLGKLKILPIPFFVRELNYPASEHQSDLMRTFSHPTHEGNDREKFFSLLASLLTETTPALGTVQAQTVVQETAQDLVECLRTGRSLMVQEIFNSEWKLPTPKPEWFFATRQFIELPFYNEKFFGQLEKIDFLLRAMPCGRHQMAELKPKLAIQDGLVAEAVAFISDHRPVEALEHLSTVFRQNPFHIEAATMLGPLLSELSQHEHARFFQRWADQLKGID